jgi:preprotein translocase subunit SecD
MQRLSGVALALSVCFASVGQGQPAAARTVKLAVYISAACGTANAQKLPGAQGKNTGLCFQKAPLLTERDVESAELHHGSKGQVEVFLSFHKDAAMRELQETKANVGSRVGIVLNGKLVSSPEIPGASRFLFIDAGFTDAQASELVTAFNAQTAASAKRGP